MRQVNKPMGDKLVNFLKRNGYNPSDFSFVISTPDDYVFLHRKTNRKVYIRY